MSRKQSVPLQDAFTCSEVDEDEKFRIMHTNPETYSEITEDEKDEYEKWLSNRDLVSLHSIKVNLIKDHPVIQVMYGRLVPSVVSDSQFWNTYFFHMERAGYHFSKPSDPVVEKEPSPVIEKESNPVKELMPSSAAY